MKKIIILLVLFSAFLTNAQNVVYTPTAGQTFINGQTIDITWNLNSSSSVDIYFQKTNNSGQTLIADNISDSGSFQWVIPNCDEYPFSIFGEGDDLEFMITSSGSTADSGVFKINNPTPNTPGNFRNDPTENTETSVKLRWDRPDSCFNTRIRVYNCATNQEVANGGGNSAVETIYNLTPNTNYNFKIKSQNNSGSSSFSSCLQVKTKAAMPEQPSQPTGAINVLKGTQNLLYSTNPTVNATSYLWVLSPNNAGDINGNSNEIQIDWDEDYVGDGVLTVKGINADGVSGSTSEALNIEIVERSPAYGDIEFYSQGTTPNSSNPNNYLNKNIPIRFKLKVDNELTESVSTLKGTITSITTGVTIIDNTANFSNIASDTSGWSSDEFEIQVDNSVASGTLLEFELSTEDQVVSGGPWISTFSFPIEPLSNGDLIVAEASGDGDNIAEPGESIKLFPKITNVSANIIANVNGILSTEGTLGITDDNNSYNVISNIQTPITPTDSEILPEFPFEFSYPASEAFQELNFSLELQGNLRDSDGPLLKWSNDIVLNEGVLAAPVLVSTDPENNAIDIALGSNLSFIMNQSITAVTGKYIHIYKENGTLVSSIETTDSQVSITDKTVNINPTTDLLAGNSYYILIDVEAFLNSSSQGFTGIQTTTSWTFSTIENTTCNHPWGSPVIYSTYTRALGIVTIDGEMATAEDKVAAYIGAELRGISDVVVNDNTAYMNLSIQGNTAETVTFKVWDTSECEEVSVAFSTQTDPPNTIGSVSDYLPIDAARTTAGLNESNLLSKSFIVYPNPTKSVFKIENISKGKITSLEIFNVLGEKVKESFTDYKTIDISKFAKGIYFLKIKTDNGFLTKKIVKE